jgi:hypothetical protein
MSMLPLDPHHDDDHEDDRLALLQRLKQAAGTSSLTLLSIVQGVALADLAGVVANQYKQFQLIQWILLLANFICLIAAWNQIVMDTVTWVNLPNMTRSFIPFILGAIELFLNHTFVHNPRAWLIGAAGLVTLSSIGIEFVNRAVADHEENAHLLSHLHSYRKAGQRYGLIGSLLFLLLAAASTLGGFAHIDALVRHPGTALIVAGVLVTLYEVSFLTRHLVYWRIITDYAQGKTSLKHAFEPLTSKRSNAE